MKHYSGSSVGRGLLEEAKIFGAIVFLEFYNVDQVSRSLVPSGKARHLSNNALFLAEKYTNPVSTAGSENDATPQHWS